MAFAAVGSLGTANTKSASASLSVAITSAAEVGNLLVAVACFDNLTTTAGASTDMSCSDDSSNTWTKIGEYTHSDGVAADGVTIGVFFCNVASQINSLANVTITTSASMAAKAMEVYEFTKGASANAALDGSPGYAGATSGQPGLVEVTGLTSRDHLFIYALGMERSNTTVTHDSDYTAWTHASTTGGASSDNVFIAAAHRIYSSSTGDSLDISTANGSQHGQVLGALYEVATQTRPYANVTIGG